jgi:hypothetical protein
MIFITTLLFIVLFLTWIIKYPKESIITLAKFGSYSDFKFKYYCLAFSYGGDLLDQQILPLLENVISTEDFAGINFKGTFKGEKVSIMKSFNMFCPYTLLATNYKFENIKLEKTIKGKLSDRFK